jgi:glycerol 3-phosphatase-2
VIEPLVHGTPAPLATRHDVALLDLDGVLYVGPDAVPDAAGSLASAAELGLRCAFVTNNASRTPERVAEHLRELGIPASAGDVVTSAQAAARLVADRVRPGARVLVVGGEGLVAALREHGLEPVTAFGDDVEAVVSGFSPDLGWRSLAEGSYAVAAGRPWVVSNLDATVPTPRGLAPGNGQLVGVVQATTGRSPDAVAGKPELPLHEEAVRRSGARRPLVVGDRLDTDIEGAVRAGTPSLLVLTGVCGPDDLLVAAPERRPTYLAHGLRDGLLEPHPPVTRDGDAWSCGAARVALRDGAVRCEGDGAIDALRALAVLWWTAHPEGADPRAAVRAIGW